ncbi:MG2 domain-containing protein [uncultured Lutibacter sp.]|uniref:alpha-2-macroglobulin family protein n=1 Tax=uncultured Lutibacter sp. TaxID=437739 RepID=UPI00261B7F2F|nr:MG2 domain-containing protein [uncultured Lutibacter sp.]
MKKVALTLITILLFSNFAKAQKNEDYDVLWKSIDNFEKKDLPKSALKITVQIFEKAAKENNSSQLIKSLLYKSKYALILEEDAQLKIINNFKQEISTAEFPTKNILESVLANLYWQYFQQNRYKFYNRTKTNQKIDAIDFRTWDLTTLFSEIHMHFQNSLKNGLMAQQTTLNNFDAILNLQKNSKKYRPTLFDFLSYNALEFYKTSETSITKPSYQFEINTPKYLTNYQQFSVIELNAKDSLSLELNALKIYQNLIAFHIKTNNKNALISADLARLQFVKQHATFNDKNNIYLKELLKLKQEFISAEASTLIDFEIASIYNEQANEYPLKNNNQFKKVAALEICNKAIKNFPNSFGAKKCKVLKQQIEEKTFHILAEKYIPTNLYSKVLVTYKNVEFLNFAIYSMNQNEIVQFNQFNKIEDKISFFNNKKASTNFEQKLKTVNDYQNHTTEVIIPPLNNNSYLIVAYNGQNLHQSSVIATSVLQVTNIALVLNNKNDTNSFQVIDRNTGQPLVGAKVHLKNYNTGKYNAPINRKFTTNNLGEFEFKTNQYHRNVNFFISFNNEEAAFRDYYLYHTNNSPINKPQEEITIKPFLFTDRSIYRPGQTVYFKGIFVKKTKENSQVFTNEFVELILEDPNGQEIQQLDLKLNDFGVVSGQFILPNNGLTGQYTILIDESYKYKSKFYDTVDFYFENDEAQISVEEYKRPKFEASFQPITESYQLNNQITIHGNAQAYSGSTISNAKVTYRVHRKAQYPKWYYWYRPSFNTSKAQEITHGETITDLEGNFNITFEAIPDKSINKDNAPIFIYEITADVTDINGETRTANAQVKVGYQALTANLSVPKNIYKNSKTTTILFETKNLNNQLVNSKGILKIYKLNSPERILRKRPWPSPDFQQIPKQEFEHKFPHEAYQDENDERNWQKGLLVFQENFDTSIASKIELKKIKKWLPGKYIVEIETTDKFNEIVTAKEIFTINDLKETKVADAQLFEISHNKTKYQPNENVLLKIGSASKNMVVTIDIEKNNHIVSTQIIQLNNTSKLIKIPVSKNDVGGFAIHYSYSKFNSFQHGTLPISVPFPEKKLEIETSTFRDHLQPGQNETWSFKLKGEKGEKIAAELLASMYDASLDQFKNHHWGFNPVEQPNYYSRFNRNANRSFGKTYFRILNSQHYNFNYSQQVFDSFNWFGFRFGRNYNILIRGAKVETDVVEEVEEVAFAIDNNAELNEVVVTALGKQQEKDIPTNSIDISSVKIRKNFQETAFFYPHLQTDDNGNVSFSFTVPEALTQWKLQLLAHTKELAYATKNLTTVTQKKLMVLPNPPRFLREGDMVQFSSKISNLSEKKLNGIAQLILTDALSGKELNYLIEQNNTNQNFIVDSRGNTQINWTLNIPEEIQAIQYKIVAKADEFSDGEQNVLPVLSNRMLVTETLPMWVKSGETKTFSLDKLKNNHSSTLKNHKLTLEITSNPAWYAVQSLPYLIEYPYECSEQTFARYYANALASHIANSNPKIQEVFNLWKNSDALISNLEKNEALKSILIQETPWLRDAQNEIEQKKRIGLLFDLNIMKNEQERALNKLKEFQFNNGGFPWFKGSKYPNRYITQHIVSSYGHLKQLNVVENNDTEKMMLKAIHFLDEEILDDYTKLLKEAEKIGDKKSSKKEKEKAVANFLNKNHLTTTQLHYLYMRSFFKNVKINAKVKTAVDYYTKQAATYWTDFNLYSKGLIALIQHRNKNPKVALTILKSLKENSISSDELGMYWKENSSNLNWYQAPIETQALLIEAFTEIENKTTTIDALKIWLLKNKQTHSWKTTKATTEAIYALLLQGSEWLSVNENIKVKIGENIIEPTKNENTSIEAGTGYFKTSWNSHEITPTMSKVTLTKQNNGIAWGSLYWQYFEDLDKITSAETALKLSKKIFLKSNTAFGKELTEVNQNSTLKVGDLITIRIALNVDRPMEFVHLKDMRVSGLEPISVLSQYKWQDNLGYYQSTKDASTNFFIEYLPKGVYIFEYDLRVNNAGNFSNGITTIQSMYAPEFSSHSKGVRINVVN